MVLNSCIYCGEASYCFDHVIPRSYLSVAKRTGTEPGFKVPTCTQCNSILGARIFKNIVERKDFVHQRLMVKLYKYATFIPWGEEELNEMGRNMRSSIEVAMAKRTIARDRLRYAAGPPEARWTEMEERWRDLYKDESIPESKVRAVS